MHIRSSAPHLIVKDLQRSVEFFVEVLGFERPALWGEPPEFAMPQRDGFIVMLELARDSASRAHGDVGSWDAYFWIDGVDDYADALRSHGAEIVEGPVDRPEYGMRELTVRDPDGHWLVFAEDTGS